MGQPLISIIVPIYKVEIYMQRCIDSILNQTYQNLEVILVDDGSPDNCGDICDKYAIKDNRIKVIHKSNGGLSSARNAGIDIAKGDFFGFVDSDDWIEADMYESLYDALIRHNADISICGRYIVNSENIITSSDDEKIQILNRYQGLSELVLNYEDGIKNYAWDKLYKRELFKSIRYPEGKFYEDIFTTYKLFSVANKIVHTKSPKYYYLLRGDSISGTDTPSKAYDFYIGSIESLENIKNTEPSLADICENELIIKISNYINNLLLLDFRKNECKKEVDNALQKLKETRRNPKNSNKLGRKIKILLFFMFINPTLYSFIYPRVHFLLRKTKQKLPQKIKNKLGYYKMYIRGYKKTKHLYEKSSGKNRIFIIGTPTHGNLGDQAIAYAEQKIVEDYFSDYEICEINALDIIKHLKSLRNNIKKDDILVLHGGGNLGNQYVEEEELRRKIILQFKNNKVILFPQTIYFTDDAVGKVEFNKTKAIYGKHKDLTLVSRENTSYEIMKQAFINNKVILSPDIVMYLNKTHPKYIRNGALTCIRKDVESILSVENREKIKNMLEINYDNLIITDTMAELTTSENRVVKYMVNRNQRKKMLNRKWDQFKKAELVVTDRLHGMVFCAITSTPCIVIGNYNHKVKDTYKWIEKLNYIKFVDNIDEIPKLIEELKNIEIGEYDNSFAMGFYKEIIAIMKEH